MADTSGFKSGVVIVAIGLAAWTYWNRSSDAAEGEALCLAQLNSVSGVRDPGAVCACVSNEAMRQVSIIHHVPIIKNFLPDPPADILRSALRMCLGR